MNNKKIIILLVVIILGGVLVWRFYPKSQVEPLPQDPMTADFSVQEVPLDQIPSALPQNLPEEADALVIRNEIIDVSQGREVQYLRTYYSAKSVSENAKTFRDFLNQEGWRIVIDQVQADFATIIAKKDGEAGDFKLTVSKNSITDDITVETVVTIRQNQ